MGISAVLRARLPIAIAVLAGGCARSPLGVDEGSAAAPPITTSTTTTSSSTTSSTTTTTSTTTTSTTTTSSATATTTTPPPLVPGVRLSHGLLPTCLLWPDGEVACRDEKDLSAMVLLPGVHDAVAVAKSLEHGCVLHPAGTVSCWGWNHHGQMGEVVLLGERTDVPLQFPNLVLKTISSGHHATCGIEPSGQALCWGGAYHGPLGDPSVGQTVVPVKVLDVPDAIDIALSFEVACAVRAGGSVWCFATGEAPHPIAGLGGATRVAVGESRACALVGGGDVVCWDLADEVLAPVPDLHDAVQIAASTSLCARRASGEVSCWDGAPASAADFWPPQVLDAVDVAAVVTGVTCAARSSGEAVCWTKDTAPTPFPGQVP